MVFYQVKFIRQMVKFRTAAKLTSRSVAPAYCDTLRPQYPPQSRRGSSVSSVCLLIFQ